MVHCTRTLDFYRYSVNLYLDKVPMNAIQLRMARAAVGWGVRELAKKAGITANTVTRIENGADAKQSTMEKLRRALEAAGLEFTNGDQPGVRLTQAASRSRSFPKAGHGKATRTKKER
jgi:transcriptional regulator with XRE-family HTH domain